MCWHRLWSILRLGSRSWRHGWGWEEQLFISKRLVFVNLSNLKTELLWINENGSVRHLNPNCYYCYYHYYHFSAKFLEFGFGCMLPDINFWYSCDICKVKDCSHLCRRDFLKPKTKWNSFGGHNYVLQFQVLILYGSTFAMTVECLLLMV